MAAIWASAESRFMTSAMAADGPQQVRDMIDTPQAYLCVGSIDREDIAVGGRFIAWTSLEDHTPKPGACHLSLIAVRPDSQRQGHGLVLVLVQHLLGTAVEAGYTEASLFVRDNNIAAITLYERLGFTPTGLTRVNAADHRTLQMKRSL